ncbi:MAG: acylphosphatase [Clostridia bacterium]|nr:acylphosphatase [Clostridia bacterium]
MDRVIRKRIRFHGLVQGVGFRYRARHAASAAGATGWVRNDLGGTVSMEIQGTEAQIDQVIGMIERGTYVRIESMEEKRIPVDEGERGFRTLDSRW